MAVSRRELLCNLAATAFAGHLRGQDSASVPERNVFPAPASDLELTPSPVIKGFAWTGPTAAYPETEKRGDTFPITWAVDDRLYTSAGDPVWPDKGSGLDVECLDDVAPNFQIS